MLTYYYRTPYVNNKAVSTVVNELRSIMFRQHPGCHQTLFLKKTQTIILSLDEYTVYIMF